MRAWIWDWLDGQWVNVNRAALLPGTVVCVASQCGGYRADAGFSPESVEAVNVFSAESSLGTESGRSQGDTCQDDDSLSKVEHWKTIACHSDEVRSFVGNIARCIELSNDLGQLLELAAEWHDVGKCHPAFQGKIRSDMGKPARCDLAKAPREYWFARTVASATVDGTNNVRFGDIDRRPGFRHELASVLALYAVLDVFAPSHAALLGDWAEYFEASGPRSSLEIPTNDIPKSVRRLLACSAEDFNLVAWLIGTHHGKVRLSLQSAPVDQDYRDQDHRGLPIRGVREGDRLPPIAVARDGGLLPELVLRLDPAAIGLSPNTGPSWRDRGGEVLHRFGPCGLAYLEAILRAADRRASQLDTSDPGLEGVMA